MAQMGRIKMRQRAERRGRRAERLAAFYLRLKGYRIVEKRYRNKMGEIDLIAMRGDVVVFIEVKARTDLLHGMEAIAMRQRRRMIRAALGYVARNSRLAEKTMRFDALIVRPFSLPVHIANAWRADEVGRG